MIYQLYPIPLCDVNLPVYYMVKSYYYRSLMYKSEDNLEEEWKRLRLDCMRYDFLLFPSVDDSQEYDADTLTREVIILKESNIRIPSKNPKPQYTEEDPEEDIGIYGIDFSQYYGDDVEYELHEYHYYIDTDRKTGKFFLVKEYDLFPYQRDDVEHEYDTLLVRSINKLLPVVKEARLGQGQWEERLEITRSMVQARSNALHILHNGGLYDIRALEFLLSHSTIPVADWRPLLDEYTKYLKLYAMHDARRNLLFASAR